MKKILLSIAAFAIASASFAQTFTPLQTTYDQYMGNSANATSCIVNGSTTGNLILGANTAATSVDADKTLRVEAAATIASGGTSWFGFLFNNPANGWCDYVQKAGGVDMSGTNDAKILVRAKSDINATVNIYIGSNPSNGYYPPTSTYNVTGVSGGPTIFFTLNLTSTMTDYVLDYNAADPTNWALWAENNNVNVYGVDPQTPNAVINIERVQIGSGVVLGTNVAADNNAITIAPNPASDFVNVTFNNMDQNGAVAKLINSNGIVVFEGALNGSTLSLAGYNKGIYMLQVISGSKVATQKVVVQ